MAWRIRDRATFDALRRSGVRARRGPVTVTYADVGSAPVPRVGYSVGRRVGGAVVRNRIRRRLRAVVSQTPGLATGAYLVSVSPEAVGLGYEELRKYVTAALTASSETGGR